MSEGRYAFRGSAGRLAQRQGKEGEAVVQEIVERGPIERELRVVRVGPNPRMLTCEYWELASRRTCRVMGGAGARKFIKGMSFKMAEPVEELAFAKPWIYSGKLPRRRGMLVVPGAFSRKLSQLNPG